MSDKDSPRFCRSDYSTPMGVYLFGSLMLAFLALIGGALYGLTHDKDRDEPALSEPVRIGPMVVKPGEESDPWVFDRGRNVYVPTRVTDPRFIHEATGLACRCGCE